MKFLLSLYYNSDSFIFLSNITGNCTSSYLFNPISANASIQSSPFSIQIQEDWQYYSFYPKNMSGIKMNTTLEIGEDELNLEMIGITSLTCTLPFSQTRIPFSGMFSFKDLKEATYSKSFL